MKIPLPGKWQKKAHEEGATFVLTNAPIAMRMGEIKKTGGENQFADHSCRCNQCGRVDNFIYSIAGNTGR